MQPLAEQGNSSAQAILGRIYYNGHGVPIDFAQAAKWTRLAAEAGVPEAQFNLGCMYDSRDGLGQDAQEAVCWYLRAAQWAFLNAQINLSSCYHSGNGLSQNESMAACWIQLAADQGEADAQVNLAIRFLNGVGVRKDLMPAYFWLSLAKDGGSRDAKGHIEDLLLMLTREQIDLIEEFKQALAWKPKSAIESGFEIFKVSAVQNIQTLRQILGEEDFNSLKIVDRKIPSIGEIILSETRGLTLPAIIKNIKVCLAGIESYLDQFTGSPINEGSEKFSLRNAVWIIRRLDNVADVGTIWGHLAANHVQNLLEYHLAIIGVLERQVDSSIVDMLLKRFALKEGLRAKNILPYAGVQKITLPLAPWRFSYSDIEANIEANSPLVDKHT